MLSVSNGSNQRVNSNLKIPKHHAEQPWFVLSAAQHFDLALSSNPAISHFYSFEANHNDSETLAIPDGCIDILFDCDATNPCAMACGSTLEARAADLKDKHRYFGVRFAQGITPDFMMASAKELIDQELDLLELVPDSEPLLTAITSQERFQNQIRLFQRFYEGCRTRDISPATSMAVREICARNGDIKISELEVITGFSSRTLQRQFSSDMGISPKAFSRIIRCQSAVRQISYQNDVNFSELACDLGFSDQPHFLREFKKLVSTTPADYLQQVRSCSYQQRIRHQ